MTPLASSVDTEPHASMIEILCHDGGRTHAPASFLRTRSGELWEELHFLGGGTIETLSDFLGRSRCATARMLTRLRSYGLVTHYERLGETVYRALDFECLDRSAVDVQRAKWQQNKINRKG